MIPYGTNNTAFILCPNVVMSSNGRRKSIYTTLRLALKCLILATTIGLIYMSSWITVYDDENNYVENLVKAQHLFNQQQLQDDETTSIAKNSEPLIMYSNVSCATTQKICFDHDSKENQSDLAMTTVHHKASTTDSLLEARKNQFDIVMAAMPHTASTTTDSLLEARKKSWNTSLAIEDRGFSCPSNDQKIVVSPQIQKCYNSTQSSSYSENIYDCIIGKLKYRFKEHSNFDTLKKFGQDVIFTTLRKPEQTILSHYRERLDWDWTYKVLYPNDNLTSIPIEEWAEKAWYRHNLFTKIFSTETQLIFRMQKESDIKPSKRESDLQISLGKDSPWLRIAIQRLKEMPFFGLFHRLDESFELFSFHLCVPMDSFKNRNNKGRIGSDRLSANVQKYFALDTLLLEEAEKIFDQLIMDMRSKKDNGMICDISKLLPQESETINSLGLVCVNEE